MNQAAYTGPDRRKYLRANGYIKVSYAVLSTEVEKVYHKEIESIVNNISVNGICFESEDELLPGVLLKMNIYLPPGKEGIQSFGKVIWQKKHKKTYNIGAAFFWIIDEDRESIAGYVKSKTDNIYQDPE